MAEASSDLTRLEEGVVALFADGVKVLGLPKSVGEIYGLLYIHEEALSLDDLVERLQVSKGTASQGLKMLRTLGAVRECGLTEGRKTYYEADVELKSLVGGFIREEIRPHLSSAKAKIGVLREEVEEGDAFLKDRVDRLDKWRAKASLLLPILQKLLSS
ncbi:GbsR/MarR family transcriptional regulator [Rubritalea spongiae]|uniref:HTH-type transcriptional regulator n=1 Tax=Rubritalea spongiae TaxID=430797 RepID=A0ABW5E1F1_9BACT